MSTVHLYVVELEGDREGGSEPSFAVASPHDHRVAELVCILVDDAVEFCLYHGRCADDHAVFDEGAPAIQGCLTGKAEIVLGKSLEVAVVGNVT